MDWHIWIKVYYVSTNVQLKQEEFEDDIMHITNGLSSPSVS